MILHHSPPPPQDLWDGKGNDIVGVAEHCVLQLAATTVMGIGGEPARAHLPKVDAPVSYGLMEKCWFDGKVNY